MTHYLSPRPLPMRPLLLAQRLHLRADQRKAPVAAEEEESKSSTRRATQPPTAVVVEVVGLRLQEQSSSTAVVVVGLRLQEQSSSTAVVVVVAVGRSGAQSQSCSQARQASILAGRGS